MLNCYSQKQSVQQQRMIFNVCFLIYNVFSFFFLHNLNSAASLFSLYPSPYCVILWAGVGEFGI